MHPAAANFCARYGNEYLKGKGLDIGGRNANGHIREYWYNVDWVIVDPLPATGTEGTDYIQADYSTWINDIESFDIILCTEVLEHTHVWRQILRNIYHDLKADGVLILTCAGEGRPPHNAVDGTELTFGEYYRNLNASDIYNTLMEAGFKRGEVTYNFGDRDLYAIAYKD